MPPLPESVGERTVPALLDARAARHGEAIALVAPSLMAGGERQVSYASLAAGSEALAGFLSAHGVGKGDRVAILLDNDGAVEAHLAYHAAHRLGAIAVPLNTHFVARELELALALVTPAAIVFAPAFAELLRGLAPIASALAVQAGGEPTGGHSLATALDAGLTAPSVDGLSEHDDADWVFTSGTTGGAKAVAFTHASSVACAHQSCNLWGLDAKSVYQSSAPFFTSTGCRTNLLGCLQAGCAYVVQERFDCRGTLATMERCRTTSTFIISGALALLLDRVPVPELDGYDLGALRRVVYGGQDMAAPFFERVQRILGDHLGVELVHLMGLTEGGTSGTMLVPQLHAGAVAEHCGPHGLTVGDRGFSDWVSWRVIGEKGQPVGAGEPGEVCFRSPAVMDRYVDDPPATEAALAGGWLHTGDIGVVDEGGFLYHVDRCKQMIRRGGLNIASAEVESVIGELDGVSEVAVVPLPNPILEQEVRAVVVSREPNTLTAGDVIAHCAKRLADYKVPVVVDFVPALPRNAMGRVVKHAIADGGPRRSPIVH